MNKHEERCKRWATESIEKKVLRLEVNLMGTNLWKMGKAATKEAIAAGYIYRAELDRRAQPREAKEAKRRYAARPRPRRHKRWDR